MKEEAKGERGRGEGESGVNEGGEREDPSYDVSSSPGSSVMDDMVLVVDMGEWAGL